MNRSIQLENCYEDQEHTYWNGVIFAFLSSAAHAADDFWEHTRLGYTIYFSGGYATTPFNPPSSVPRRDAEITDVSWDWNTIPNGHTSEEVELCYRKQYSSSDFLCIDISAAQNDNSDAFDGFNARGTFHLRFTLVGGAYSTIRTAGTVRVDYSY